MSKKLLATFISLLAVGVLGSATPALAARNWTPASAKALLDSTNTTLTITGLGELKCKATSIQGTLPAASPTFEAIPAFKKCTAPITPGAAKWKLNGISATEASLTLPKEAATINLGTCTLTLSPTGTTTITLPLENWEGGTPPSIWMLEGKIPFSSAGTGCPTATEGSINSTINAWDLTTITSEILP